jgi:hypothetical protein
MNRATSAADAVAVPALGTAGYAAGTATGPLAQPELPAYGYVHADGAIDASRSLNLLASAVEDTNVYCLRFVSAPKNLVASVDAQFGRFVM